MAITNTRTVQRVEVEPNGDDPMVVVWYNHTFDDDSDASLPVQSAVQKTLQRYTINMPEDDGGSPTQVATDVSAEDQLVQDICAAIWTD